MDLDNLFNGKEGYSIKTGDLAEWIIMNMMSNNFLTSEILRRQIEIEQKINKGSVDSDAVSEELKNITDAIAEQATEKKNELIAKFFLKNKE